VEKVKKCSFCGCWKPGRHKQWCKSIAAQEIQKDLAKTSITIPLDYVENIIQVLGLDDKGLFGEATTGEQEGVLSFAHKRKRESDKSNAELSVVAPKKRIKGR
jgi:hypothetical protein